MIEALLQAERLLIHGQLDQAERIYSSAFAQDSNNAIAVVGLARVALERGDDRLAYERARKALEIDPQNDAAVRLEARLAEVFSNRGEAQPAPPQPEPRPSETAVFTRNPSMAEHQRMDDERSTGRAAAYDHVAAPRSSAAPAAPAAGVSPRERSSLLRRLFGR